MLVLSGKLNYIKIKYVNRLQCRKTAAENPNKSELDFLSLPSYSGLRPNFVCRKTRHAVLSTGYFLICVKSFTVASSVCNSSKQKENFNKSEKRLMFSNKPMGLRHLPVSYPQFFKIPERFPMDIEETSHLVYSI